MGEKYMMTKEYYHGIETEVVIHEESMFQKYGAIVEKYRDRFSNYGCGINMDLVWLDSKSNDVYKERPNLFNGYECVVHFSLEKNGEMVSVNPSDNAALSASWAVCSVSNRIKLWDLFKRKIYVVLYSDTTDADEDLEQFITLLNEFETI
jgi:hypothetical protein